MNFDKRERVNFVLKKSCWDMALRLMDLSGITNPQVFFVELIKKFYKIGPSRYSFPSNSLHSQEFRNDEADVQCWCKPLPEEVNMLKELCTFHGCIRMGEKVERPYRYSKIFKLMICHSIYLLEKREKERMKEKNKKVEVEKIKYSDPIGTALAINDFPEDVITDDFFR